MISHRLVPFAVVLIVGLLLFSSLIQVAAVQGESMMPALRDGQYVVAVRRFGRLRRGDVILLRRGQSILVKRIAYLPSDRIAPLDRPLFQEVQDFFEVGDQKTDLIVPEGKIVVLGDNRPKSDDSRHFGPIRTDDVVGKVIGATPFP